MTSRLTIPLLLVTVLAGAPSLAEETPADAAARAAIARGDVEGAHAALQGLGDAADRRLADLLRESGRPEEALPYYRRAMKRAPDDPAVAMGYGRSLVDLGRYAEAIAPLETAARDGEPEAVWALGLAGVRGGNLPDGLARLREARDLRVEPHASSAAELYDYFIERYRPELDLARTAGREALEAGRQAEAARLLLGYALAVGAAPSEALDGARAALVAGLDPDLATRGFRMALEHGSPNQQAEAHTGLGAAHLHLGEPGAARAEFVRALELDAANVDANFGLALALARTGSFGEAATHLERALADATEDERKGLLKVARSEKTFTGRRADPRLKALARGR